MAVNVSLPDSLANRMNEFVDAYDALVMIEREEENTVQNMQAAHEEAVVRMAALQDESPGFFAHKSLKDVRETVRAIDVLMAEECGLPRRY